MNQDSWDTMYIVMEAVCPYAAKMSRGAATRKTIYVVALVTCLVRGYCHVSSY
jgi:hypothetical protein